MTAKSVDLITEEGPSQQMQATYSKFDQVVAFLDECYHNRVTYEMEEESNHLTDSQIHYLMEEFARTVGQVLRNKENE